MIEREEFKRTISYLESQRANLGDAAVEAAIAVLREKLAQDLTGKGRDGAPSSGTTGSPAGEAPRQRRRVSALCASIAGLARLSEKLGAEEAQQAVRQVWQRLDEVLLQQGGWIARKTEGSLMAQWGLKQAQANDAERAIRAALEMKGQLIHWAQEQQVELNIRVGIHTGLVILEEANGELESAGLEEVSGLGAHLERAAPPNGILISADTYRQVRGVFDVLNLDPISIRGRSEAIPVHLVRHAKPRAFRKGGRGIEGLETRMIGRSAEMALLQGLFWQFLQHPKPSAMPAEKQTCERVVTIWGDPGLGKSRLLHEFDVWAETLQQYFYYFKGRCEPSQQPLPYSLLRNLFAYRFQIRDSDSVRVVGEKIAGGLQQAEQDANPPSAKTSAPTQAGPRDELLMRAHYIGQLLGYSFENSPHLRGAAGDGPQARQRGLRYIKEYFCLLMESDPLLLLLEDLHWADEASLDVLEDLAHSLCHKRMLIVQTCRPQLKVRRPAWGQDGQQIQLEPLDDEEGAWLVDELLQKVETIPDVLRKMLIREAKGNPLYIEELIKLLIEEDAILPDCDRWTVNIQHLALAQIPANLNDVLQARFDRLPAHERTVLQRAAVMGRTFWSGAVAHLGDSDGEGPLPGDAASRDVKIALQALQMREMIFQRDDSSFLGAEEYTFKHALLREMVYSSILNRDRLTYHTRAADWLRLNSGEQDAGMAGLIAQHLELACQPASAGEYLRRGAERALKIGAHNEALHFCERALEQIPPESDDKRMQALLLTGQLLALAGNDRQARLRLEQCLILARKLDDGPAFAKAYIYLGRLTLAEEQLVEARSQLAEGLNLARETGQSALIAQALLELSLAEVKLGELQAARQHQEECLKLYYQLKDQRGVALTLLHSGAAAIAAGQDSKAEARLKESRALFQTLDNQWGIQAAQDYLNELERRLARPG